MSTILQILITLKAADATALTAREAIQSLLGFGDDLVTLHRFRVIESTWSGEAGATFSADLEQYLDRSVEFWNPNRERCWARLCSGNEPVSRWEFTAGKGKRAGKFGEPDLEEAGQDQVLVASLGPAIPVADFPTRLGSANRVMYHGGELFTTRWRTSGTKEERMDRLHRIAEVRSRHQGLLVHPEFQDRWLIAGPLPVPLWEESGPAKDS